jgi:hypothetical protein
VRNIRVTLARAIVLAGAIAASPALRAQTAGVETEPIRCWRRTSAPAVRVGEPFSIVLTCAVVETEPVTVVPTEAELAPNAVQLPPFDVLGGSHPADLRTEDHRFFQYEYRVRLVSDEFFGRDVLLTPMKITYKVRTRLENEAIEGRDQSYVLPDATIRVLSLVPDNGGDIRDASSETFDGIDRRIGRANLLRVSGLVLMGFAALAAVIALVRLAGGMRARRTTTRSLVSDGAVLRQLGRELGAIGRARRESEWTPALNARLLTAVRILSGYALELPVTAVPPVSSNGMPSRAGDAVAPPDRRVSSGVDHTREGELVVRLRGMHTRNVVVPAWVTPTMVADERARLERSAGGGGRSAALDELQRTLSLLTAAQYGREKTVDESALDAALASASGMLRRLRIANTWIGKKLRSTAFTKATLEDRLWSQ